MICDACDQPIDFGAVKIFKGRMVCSSCFTVLSNGNGQSARTESAIQHCGCGQSLRIPTDQGPLIITCPKCRAVWNWPPSTERATSPATEYKPPATESMPATNSAGTQSKNNSYALTSFALGIASVFLYQIGILPLLGIVFGVIGLSTFREPAHKNKWMAVWGLILSILYMVVSVSYWKQLGMSPSEALSKPAPTVREPTGEFRLRRRN